MNSNQERRGKIKTPPCKEVVDNIISPNLAEGIKRNFQAYVDINRAHVLMLAKCGILKSSDAAAILEVNEEMAAMGSTPQFFIDPKREDLYFNMEHFLIDRVGMHIGGQQHTARSRNDMTSTVTRLVGRKSFFKLCFELLKFRKILLGLAERNINVAMAGYTHLQPSEPISFGHYCSAVLASFQRDYERISSVYPRLNVCPLGGTSMGSSTWSIDRNLTAELLGFDAPVNNSLDCVASRDYALELISDMAICGNTLCRICNDFYVWSTPDYGYVEVEDSVAVCSSIMPQKKNPWTLEFIKGKTGSIEGSLMAALSTLRSTPFTYCLDMSGVAMENLWRAFDQMESALELTCATFRDLKVNKERMLATAKGNYCTVTELANTLVRKDGISFREAHKIVALVVDWMLSNNKKANEISSQEVNKCAVEILGRSLSITNEEVLTALDPERNINAKSIIGGTSPQEVSRQLNLLRLKIEADEEALNKKKEKVELAFEKAKRQAWYLINQNKKGE